MTNLKTTLTKNEEAQMSRSIIFSFLWLGCSQSEAIFFSTVHDISPGSIVDFSAGKVEFVPNGKPLNIDIIQKALGNVPGLYSVKMLPAAI